MRKEDYKQPSPPPQPDPPPPSKSGNKSQKNGGEAPKGLFEAAWRLLVEPLPPLVRKLVVGLLAVGGIILAAKELLPARGSASADYRTFVIEPGELHLKGGPTMLADLKSSAAARPAAENASATIREISVERLVVDSNAVLRLGSSNISPLRIVAKEAIFKGPFTIDARGSDGQNGAAGISPRQPGYGAKGGNGTPGGHGAPGHSGKDVELWLGLRSLQQIRYLTVDTRGGRGGDGGPGGSGGLGGEARAVLWVWGR